MLSGASWTILHKVLRVQSYPKCIKRTLNRIFFHVQCCLAPLGNNIAQRFYLCNVLPSVLRQQWTGFFSCAMLSGASWITLHKVFTSQCNVVPRELRQHWKGFFLMQCCLRASRTTLHKVFTCAVLFQEYLWQHWTGCFLTECFLCNVVWSLLDNIAQGFITVPCCPKSIKTTLNKIFSCAMLSEASSTTLHKSHKAFTCAVLVHS